MGFGADQAERVAFVGSGSLMGDLGTRFVGAWVGDLISLGAAISAFGCALACAVGASRLLYALSRDGFGPSALAIVSPSKKTPVNAALVVVFAMYLIIAVFATAFSAKPFDAFFYSGTIGTLILLVVYVLATLGAMRLVFFSGDTGARRSELIVPVLALVVLGYTLFRNVWPYPQGAAAWLPVVCVGWLLAAVTLVIAKPEIARRAGERLTAEEGLSRTPATAWVA